MENAVIYARVSSKEQNEGYSITSQLKLLRDYTRKNGLFVENEFVDVQSAKKSGRKAFNEMVRFISKNGTKKIITEKVDRFSRNFKDADIIESLGVEIHLVKENEIISSESTSHSKLIFGFKTLLAKHFLDNLSEETKKGMREKVQEGGYPSLAPLGYQNIDKMIEIDSERADLIKKSFELYATGDYSIQTLTDELNRRGLRSRKGLKLVKRSIQTILKNPIYYGWFKWSGQIWKGSHVPIISKELYDKVQNRLNEKHTSGRLRGKWFAFKGLLRCGYCGHSITAETHKGHNYYSCANPKKCGQDYHREEKIEKMFADALGKLRLDDKVKEWTVEALRQSHEEEEQFVKKELAMLQRESTRNETKKHQIYQDKLEGEISKEFLIEEFNGIQQRQQEIQSDMARLQQKNNDYMQEGLLILELVQDIKNQYLKADMEQKSKMLKILLSNLELKGVDSSFHWNKPFDILYKLGESENRGE